MNKKLEFNSIEELVNWLMSEKPEVYFKDITVNNISRMLSVTHGEYLLNTMKLDIELFPNDWKSINGAMVKKDNLGYAIVFDDIYYFMD